MRGQTATFAHFRALTCASDPISRECMLGTICRSHLCPAFVVSLRRSLAIGQEHRMHGSLTESRNRHPFPRLGRQSSTLLLSLTEHVSFMWASDRCFRRMPPAANVGTAKVFFLQSIKTRIHGVVPKVPEEYLSVSSESRRALLEPFRVPPQNG